MSKQNTRATIDANIKQNGQQLITGQILNSVLNTMVTDYAEQAETTEKLTDLERKSKNISAEETESEVDEIVIEDNDGNEVVNITPNGVDCKNLKSNGESVLTESDITEIEEKVKDIASETTETEEEEMSFETDGGTKFMTIKAKVTDSEEEEQIWSNDAETEDYARVGSYGVKAKSFKYMDGSSIKSYTNVFIVDKEGKGDFDTITDAINATNDGDTILVMGGVYEEHINMINKLRHLVGVSKESVFVVSHSGLRSENPCDANVGSIENITFVAMADQAPSDYWTMPEVNRATYGIHIDSRYVSLERHEITIKNCLSVSHVNAGIGIGIRFNQTINLVDCEFVALTGVVGHSNTNGGMQMHNDDFYPDSEGAELNIDNCILRGEVKAVNISSLHNNALCIIRFTRNLCYSEQNGTSGAINAPINKKWGDDISLSPLSYGNNINEINY